MCRGEESPCRGSGRPQALPVAQRAEDVAAKEKKLFLGRREDRKDYDQDEHGQRSVGAQPLRQWALVVADSERHDPQPGNRGQRDPDGKQQPDRASERRAPQPEVGGARSAVHVGHEERHPDRGDVHQDQRGADAKHRAWAVPRAGRDKIARPASASPSAALNATPTVHGFSAAIGSQSSRASSLSGLCACEGSCRRRSLLRSSLGHWSPQ